MTEEEACKVHIQYTFHVLCKIWVLKTGRSGQTARFRSVRHLPGGPLCITIQVQ